MRVNNERTALWSNLSASSGTAATACGCAHLRNGETMSEDMPCVGVPTRLNQTGIVGERYRPLQRSGATCGRVDLRAMVARRQWQQLSITPSTLTWAVVVQQLATQDCMLRYRRIHVLRHVVHVCRPCCTTSVWFNRARAAQTTLISPGEDRREAAAKRPQHPTRDNKASNLLAKDTILAFPASAIIQLLPHVRLQEQGVVARRPERPISLA